MASGSFARRRQQYWKENGLYRNRCGGGGGVFEMLRCSLVLCLLAFISVVLIAATYSNNPFSGHHIATVSQSVGGLGRRDGEESEDRRRIGDCNLTGGGKWVRDTSEKPAMYTNRSCPTIPDSKNCAKYGKDMDFVNWRWTPEGCDLPRFDAKRFLSIVRGKTIGFIGDSVARNQYESLLCLLSQEETPTEIYRDAEDRFRTWHFPSHDFTLKILWTRFFVKAEELLSNGTGTGDFKIYTDSISPTWSQQRLLRDIDVAIISNGHWFFRKLYLYGNNGRDLLGCVFCSEENVPTITVASAIRMAFRTMLDFMDGCADCKDGLLTVLRTFSPSHFENGSWDGGGYCNRTRPNPAGDSWEVKNSVQISDFQLEELDRVLLGKEEGGRGGRFEALAVTKLMLERGDGHPGKHWNNVWMKGYNDCTHWCLPGAIDTWNELLLQILARRRRRS